MPLPGHFSAEIYIEVTLIALATLVTRALSLYSCVA